MNVVIAIDSLKGSLTSIEAGNVIIDNNLTELNDCNFKIACDVNNPLFGENGATYIYCP